MLHRIDGILFAVGVLDYTPRTLSSVYLFYDPEYSFLNPGTLCALKEIEYCQLINQNFDNQFKYYYMGFYFQDCQKSVYKGTFKPSQVSCPHTHKFVYLSDEVRALIDNQKKPKLYETVVTNKQGKETQANGMFDHTKIEQTAEFVREPVESAEKKIDSSF